jgi:ribosomal subunit interface protein
MKTNIKATNIALTPALNARIDKACARLEKLSKVFDPETLYCGIEVARTTRHHAHGKVFKAEITLSIGGAKLRASEKEETIVRALKLTEEEIRRELVRYKDKRKTKARRDAARLKRGR